MGCATAAALGSTDAVTAVTSTASQTAVACGSEGAADDDGAPRRDDAEPSPVAPLRAALPRAVSESGWPSAAVALPPRRAERSTPAPPAALAAATRLKPVAALPAEAAEAAAAATVA